MTLLIQSCEMASSSIAGTHSTLSNVEICSLDASSSLHVAGADRNNAMEVGEMLSGRCDKRQKDVIVAEGVSATKKKGAQKSPLFEKAPRTSLQKQTINVYVYVYM